MTRRAMGGSTDGTIARIGGAATGEAAHGSKRRRDDDKGSAATNEAAWGYKFYHQPKLRSHLVTFKSGFKLKFLNDLLSLLAFFTPAYPP